MTRLYLVRHGAVQAEGIFYGHLDVQLSAEGVAQLGRTAAALAALELAAVYCSDLARAAHSARLLAEPHGLQPVEDPAFREMNLGVLEGLGHEEARRSHPALAVKRYEDMWSFRFPGGENLQDIADRARPALADLLARHSEPHEAVALVAHNSVNRVLLGDALGLPLDRVFGFAQDFGCVNVVDYGGRTRVRLLNWTPGPLDPP